jgi:hypothetical protein
MKQFQIKRWTWLWVLLVVLTAVPVQAQEQPTDPTTTRTLTFESLGYENDRRATGVRADLTYNLNIPRSWEPVTPTIRLHFGHSSLLLPDLSHMNISYNGVPLTDVRLTQENEANGWLEVTVPETALKPGSHRLSIIIQQRVHEQECVDNDSTPGLWTVIYHDSTITFESRHVEADLSWYPEPISAYGRKAFAPVNITVVLPENPQQAEMEAAARIMTKLGQIAGIDQLNIGVNFGALPPGGHAIVVGKTARVMPIVANVVGLPLPIENGRFTAPPASSQQITPDDGVIQLTTTADESGLLIVTGETDLGVERAGRALADDTSLSLMAGPYAIIKETPQPAVPPQPVPVNATLEQVTGVGTRRVEGITIETAQYCFRTPPNTAFQQGASVDLRYTHSPLVWEDRSAITVRFNKATLNSVALVHGAVAEQSLVVPLPADKFIQGYNCIEVEFMLRLDRQECGTDFGQSAWAEVSGDSLIYLPQAPLETEWMPDFDQYPYPFNTDVDLTSTTIVMPVTPTGVEMTAALEMAARLGSDTRYEMLQLNLLSSDNWDKEAAHLGHYILIGDARWNAAVAELQAVLTQKANYETAVKLREELILRQQNGAPTAIAELINSPWDPNQGVLWITSQSDKALMNMYELLTANPNEEPLDGNIITVNDLGVVHTVDTFNRFDLPTTITVDKETGQAVQETVKEPATIRWFLIGGSGLLGLTVLVGTVLFIRDRRARKKKAENNRLNRPPLRERPSSPMERRTP